MSALDNCVIYKVAIGSLGTRKKANTGAVTVKAQNGGADPDRDQVYVAKEILEHPKLDAVFKAQQGLRKYLLLRSLPSILERGHYAVPKVSFKEVRDGVKVESGKIAAAVEDFLLVYEEAKETARKKLGVLYNPDDYPDPDKIRASFYVKTRIRSLDLPVNVKALIGEDQFKEEEKALKEDISNADDELLLHMRKTYYEYVQRLVDRLTPDSEGKTKVFHDTLVTNLTDFHKFFAEKNVVNDQVLAKMVASGTPAIEDLTATDLRGSPTLRKRVLQTFVPIRIELSSLLPKTGRKVVLD